MCFFQRKKRITRARPCVCFKCSLAATVVKIKVELKAGVILHGCCGVGGGKETTKGEWYPPRTGMVELTRI